ncbi:MAG TPA: hypothetical protein ENN85_06240 [Methanoculleus sp.]|nr:hypothetical protein [Methanoculleus sp.]
MGTPVHDLTMVRRSVLPPKKWGSVRMERAVQPPARNSPAIEVASISGRMLPCDGEADFSSAITATLSPAARIAPARETGVCGYGGEGGVPMAATRAPVDSRISSRITGHLP